MAKRESAACGGQSGEHWRTSRQWHPALGEYWRARTGLRFATTSRQWHPAVLAVLAGLAALAAAGCRREPVERVEARQAMDTEVMVRVVAPSEAVARRALAMAWEEMDLCAAKLDRYRKPSAGWLSEDAAVRLAARKDPAQWPSDVWRINRDAGEWDTDVDPLVTSCLGAAKEVWEVSGGAFDPTVGPLIDLWREAAAAGSPPSDEAVAQARARVGMDKVEMLIATVQRPPEDLPRVPPGTPPPGPDELNRMVYSVGLGAGMRLDLGGIAKGYIAGRMAHRMEQAGAIAGLVAAAGDVYAFGERPRSLVAPGGDPRWGVGVQDPRYPQDRSRLYTAVRIRDQGVDTSGHYYRGFTIGAARYSHIIDPRTGRPADTRLASVTVVADSPAVSDALATAIAVLGVKDGLALVEKTDGVECLLLELAPVPASVGGEPETKGEAPIIAHRSKGFAAMEYTPTEPDAGP